MDQLQQFFNSQGLSGKEGLKISTAHENGTGSKVSYTTLRELFEKFEDFKASQEEEG